MCVKVGARQSRLHMCEWSDCQVACLSTVCELGVLQLQSYSRVQQQGWGLVQTVAEAILLSQTAVKMHIQFRLRLGSRGASLHDSHVLRALCDELGPKHTACVCCPCSKTFGTYLIQQHNRSKRQEAEQLVQAAAKLTEAAAAPKADDNNGQTMALVRCKHTACHSLLCFPYTTSQNP